MDPYTPQLAERPAGVCSYQTQQKGCRMAPMQRILMIDGENFKGKIKAVFVEAGKEKPIWHQYDFRGLIDKVLNGVGLDKKVFYFAKIKEHSSSLEKSKELIEQQRLLKNHLTAQGFEVVLTGRVRGQMEKDKKGREILVFKEKGVDVKIAVDMVTHSCDKTAVKIVLASSDSDLQPAISEVGSRGIECIYLGFENNPNKGISYTTKRTILIRDSEVFEFESVQLPLVR